MAGDTRGLASMQCPGCGGKLKMESIRQYDGYRNRTYICTECRTKYYTIEVFDGNDVRTLRGLPRVRRREWDDESLTYLVGGHIEGGLTFAELAADLNCGRDQVAYEFNKRKRNGTLELYLRRWQDES